MEQYKEFIKTITLEAGQIIKSNFLKEVKREWKEDNSPVTATDKEINSLVIRKIKESYPNHSILAEEESDVRESEYVWVCDPIDGTIPFSHGYPTCVFTLALVKNGEVILATIYDPFMDRLLIAEKGKGVFLNNQKISVSEVASLQKTLVEVGTWMTAPYDLSSVYGILLFKGCQTTTIRSTVYAGMLVALGQFAGIIFGGDTPWDGAAIKLIVEEAGGKVTDLFGHDQRYDTNIKGFIASNGKVHDQLVEVIKSVPQIVDKGDKINSWIKTPLQ